ncbi:hypothetical protein GMDG_04367 [Pseudogymnoascus destructans 20631-21]|uniref:Uncharacterized protein n=1 Tax=Pseudogymnoascus destructans (strain ATCC MYA-4855 / 20631-21) TaxID=658429 RepID=L8GAG2_PSED2|nr:hypothetical protein GMDG_04367 [Pseudogymnoascus destructans 20631-21]
MASRFGPASAEPISAINPKQGRFVSPSIRSYLVIASHTNLHLELLEAYQRSLDWNYPPIIKRSLCQVRCVRDGDPQFDQRYNKDHEQRSEDSEIERQGKWSPVARLHHRANWVSS